ncbi:MAG TPA: maleylpyruvate isomerase N-terminal domain-containing protein [Sporichthya sp.]|nr:maleylpyruvate isomerase N-terminal domain-containing protein [Sporichthya sp.]
MAAAGVDQKDTLTALAAASGRLVALVRSLGQADGSRAVPGLGWNVAETVAHVVTTAGRLLGDRRRGATPEDVRRLNEVCLEELGDRDMASLAECLDRDLGVVVGRVYPKVDFDRRYPFHANMTISGGGGAAFFLCELLVHGYDIAAATDRDWQIPLAEAAIAARGPAEFWCTVSEPAAWPMLAVDLGEPRLLELPVRPGTADVEGPLQVNPLELLLAEFGRTTPSDPRLGAVLAGLPQM